MAPLDLTENPLDKYLQIVDGKLTLTGSTLPGAPLQDLLLAYNGGQPLVIESATKQSTATTVTVGGTASFMNVASLPVTAIFMMDEHGTPMATLRFTLIGETPGPSSWRFTTSFPQLPVFPDSKSDDDTQPHFLDTLVLRNAAFILTTAESGQDAATGAPLSFGLNFAGRMKPKGLIGLFGSLLGADPEVTLFGPIYTPSPTLVTPPRPLLTYPWATKWEVPGLHLQADLGIDYKFDGSNLQFHETKLRIYCPESSAWLKGNRTYTPTTAITGCLEIPSAGIKADLAARSAGGFQSITLGGTFEGVSLENLAKLGDLANGDDLFDQLPDELKKYGQALGGISLEAAGISFTGSLSPSAVYITVGIPNTQIASLPGFTVSSPYVTFMISQPFAAGRSVSATIGGTLALAGTPFGVSLELPELVGRASLQEQATLPLSKLFTELGLPAPADLSVDMAELMVGPSGYMFNALMADSPPWTLDLGPTPMTVSGVQLALSKDATGAHGTFAGNVDFGDDVSLGLRYDVPGDFLIRADFPEVALSQLMAKLNEIGIELPKGFDISFKQTWVLIQKQGADLTFTAATNVDDLGLVAFTAQKQQQWGFAMGVDLNVGAMFALPGLDVLKPFEDFVGLDKVMLVVSSLATPGFQFPDMAQFNVPALGSKNVKLPPQAGGLVRGLNFYAQLNTTKSQGFQALAKYLGIKLDGTVGVALAVSLPDPSANSKLFLTINQEIAKGTTLSGMFGGLLQGHEVGAFLTGLVKTNLQGQPISFDVTAMVLENGVLISGTMKGNVKFNPLPVQLSNVGLVVGIDWEGIPSLGFAATMDVQDFNSSVAFFFDSIDSAKSMVAGAISNVNLQQIARLIAGQGNLPGALTDVLAQVGLKGIKAFTMPATAASALDNRDLAAIATAFQQYGATRIPATSDGIMMQINTKGSVWHLTDLSTMLHYSLTKQGDKIQVDLQPQVYCAPQETYIGSLKFPQAFYVDAEIDFLMLQAQLRVFVNPSKGIAADVDVTPITIYKPDFFSVKAANGSGGPRLSLATFSQPNLPDKNLQGPHFLVNGMLRLLGLDISSIYVTISSKGFDFDIKQQVNAAVNLDVHGTFDSLTNLGVGGKIVVGVNQNLDLGKLGKVQVKTDVKGTLDIGVKGSSAYATITGGFDFQGIHGEIPKLNLNVDGPALANIADTVWNQVKDIVTKALKDADRWLSWVKAGVIQGVGQSAQQVGQILRDAYGMSADQVASATQRVLGYGADQLAAAMQGAGAAADQVAQTLGNMGYQAAEISKAVAGVFKGQHVDTNFGHVDTPAGPHADTPKKHVDVPKSHIDTKKLGFHTDKTITPHGDTSTPHVDASVPPHVDTGTHIDVKS